MKLIWFLIAACWRPTNLLNEQIKKWNEFICEWSKQPAGRPGRSANSLFSFINSNHPSTSFKSKTFDLICWWSELLCWLKKEKRFAAPLVAFIGWFWLNGMARWTPAPFHQTNQLNSLHKSITSNSILNLFHGVEWNKWNWMVSFMREGKRLMEMRVWWGLLGWKPITNHSVIKNLWFLWRKQQTQPSNSIPSINKVNWFHFFWFMSLWMNQKNIITVIVNVTSSATNSRLLTMS